MDDFISCLSWELRYYIDYLHKTPIFICLPLKTKDYTTVRTIEITLGMLSQILIKKIQGVFQNRKITWHLVKAGWPLWSATPHLYVDILYFHSNKTKAELFLCKQIRRKDKHHLVLTNFGFFCWKLKNFSKLCIFRDWLIIGLHQEEIKTLKTDVNLQTLECVIS